MYHLATLFDKNYLPRGLALYDSLKNNCLHFTFYVLCLDDLTFDYFRNNKESYPEIVPITLNDIECSDAELLDCKSQRSTVEYYFTLSPCLPLYILKHFKIPHICTLDADILILSDPVSLFNHLNEYSIVITPHKFSPELRSKEKYGMFNVSFQVFKNDETGILCLSKWRAQCIDWCFDRLDPAKNRFADQKYLDDWPELYAGKLKVLNDMISGLAAWNLNNYRITSKGGKFYSNDKQIIFFHFHYFKFFNKNWASHGFHRYQVKRQKGIDKLYFYYWKMINHFTIGYSVALDASARHGNPSKIIKKIFDEESVYYNFMNLFILDLSFKRLPLRIKNFLLYRYA